MKVKNLFEEIYGGEKYRKLNELGKRETAARDIVKELKKKQLQAQKKGDKNSLQNIQNELKKANDIWNNALSDYVKEKQKMDLITNKGCKGLPGY